MRLKIRQWCLDDDSTANQLHGFAIDDDELVLKRHVYFSRFILKTSAQKIKMDAKMVYLADILQNVAISYRNHRHYSPQKKTIKMTAEPLLRNRTNQVSMNMTSFAGYHLPISFCSRHVYIVSTDGSVRKVIARKTSLFFILKKEQLLQGTLKRKNNNKVMVKRKGRNYYFRKKAVSKST